MYYVSNGLVGWPPVGGWIHHVGLMSAEIISRNGITNGRPQAYNNLDIKQIHFNFFHKKPWVVEIWKSSEGERKSHKYHLNWSPDPIPVWRAQGPALQCTPHWYMGGNKRFFWLSRRNYSLATVALDIDGWDSLAQTILMLELESEFAIRFTAAELLNFNNVSEIVEAIFSHQLETVHT